MKKNTENTTETRNQANTMLPTRLLHKVKRWNWTLFGIVLLVCCIGALGNKSITNLKDGLILVVVFGIPIGLIWAWLTSDN
jgi:hypothetical protein